MAVTRSRATERTEIRRTRTAPALVWRRIELMWLLAACLLVASALFLAYRAKSAPFAEIEKGLAAKSLLNLNNLAAREDLLPALAIFPDPSEREFVAQKIFLAAGDLPNAGALARIRVTAVEVRAARGVRGFRERLGDRESMPLLTGDEFRDLKPLFVVRTPGDFRRQFRLWSWLFIGALLLVHVWWSIRGFRGEEVFLPAVLALSGVGLALMISLRDPVRDNLLFVDFAQGAVAGAVILAVASGLDYQRLFGRLSFVPLLASFVLSALLILFGSGPGTSDAKVNLLGFQPVEVIRILLVFFLAGYFATRWDILRHARETRASVAALTRRVDIPPLEYILPVIASVGLALVFFFLQKDMGPALVFACLFLLLYGLARGSAFAPAAGFVLLAGGFYVGYLLGVPHTVSDRVAIWLSPWDNLARGGDQVAHSLWAFSTGGFSGTGIGKGDAQLVPAAHTDLILSALGEEWGFLGVAAAFGLFAFLVYRSLRIALRARSDYELFLAAGLASATALQVLLIACGALGLVPLSGVVTPFLSYGRSALLANFLVIGILLSISARAARDDPGDQPGTQERTAPFRRPIAVIGILFAIGGGAALAKAAYVQVFRSDATMGRGTLVVQADGARRFQYNPRFQEVMQQIPLGTVYDRNGLPLATSDWSLLEKNRERYQKLGVDIDTACRRTDARHYPFGGLMFDLLGDLRTRERWGARNTAFVERDSSRRIRGYDDRPTLVEVKNPKTGAIERTVRYDYRELVGFLRHRHDPKHPEVRRILDRPRDLRMTVDARLQLRVAEILRSRLQAAGREKGAAVVMDSATGDLLASVSMPLADPLRATAQEPATDKNGTPRYLDRSRYGLYPPGSTFKIVTAIAALRKDAGLMRKGYSCIRLPDGRVGNYLNGSRRPIRDDVQDHSPHGAVNMERGITVSCNAYFAQLGTYDVGADALFETANLMGITTASPNTAGRLKESLPQSSYGQGQVVASPFQMARVAATVANGGRMPQGRWIGDETNPRAAAPQPLLGAEPARELGRFMREVVTSGTGRRASGSVPTAGKTGTAELANAPSHAWFIGFAPYGGARKIAFSILVENGVYGGTAAAPAAPAIVNAAAQLGLIQP